MKKRKTSKKQLPSFVSLLIYGIWSKEDKRVVFISLEQEDVETEYDLEGYSEETHVIVAMPTYYDISSLELQVQ